MGHHSHRLQRLITSVECETRRTVFWFAAGTAGVLTTSKQNPLQLASHEGNAIKFDVD